MPKAPDITGQKFGMWTALGRSDVPSKKGSVYRCQCECGATNDVLRSLLVSGGSKSCGCHWGTNGLYRSRTHNSWSHMKQRCLDANFIHYSKYGGRGIAVCERWMIFKNFLADMGEAPDGHSLERIDVNGNYEPGNCVWASRETQANNRRGIRQYLVDGEWRSRKQLQRYWGATVAQVAKRLPGYEMKVIGEEQ